MIEVHIGRTSGPCTDMECSSLFTPEQISLVKDVIAMVNSATNHKEGWYVRVGDDPTYITPTCKEQTSK